MKDRKLPKPILSIDVEDWFQVENLRKVCLLSKWDKFELRVQIGVEQILKILEAHSTKATFFIVGYIAERLPSIVKKIADLGHEIATHGFWHQLVNKMTHKQFRDDLRRCKKILEDLSGQEIWGFRAPCFSITDWALDILKEEGFKYDSSYNPSYINPRYGKINISPRRLNKVWLVRKGLLEIPLPVLDIGLLIPWAGGGYFRLFPYSLFKWGIKKIIRKYAYYHFFIHPWELDPNQPRIKALPWLKRFQHYVNLNKTLERFKALLNCFQFQSVKKYLLLLKNSP
jgi:polysaccharide deacetylase family protein (PEP-CTERM system associated)